MGFGLVGVGEVLWDMLPTGRQMGGAPANFICHARALGSKATLVSRVGSDSLGKEILSRLEGLGVTTDAVGVDPHLPTGTVSVEVSADGQPKFTIRSDVAWDAIEASDPALRAAQRCDAICFGTLALRSEPSRQAILRIVDQAPRSALRVLDINMRPPFVEKEIIAQALAHADVLKLNDDELSVLAQMFVLTEQSVTGRLAELSARFSLRLIALTRGAAGSVLWPAEGRPSDHPGFKVNVVDAVGAGDSFTAAMILGYFRGWDLDQINDRANKVAAFVCSQPGATPTLPPELVSLWTKE
jgi:fructokinase